MGIFQNSLWGFTLDYPDDWVQRSHAGADGFIQKDQAFDQAGVVDEQAAHLLVRGEFNGERESIAPRWNQHITRLSLMMGAKKIGSAHFSMGGANGFEAEIQLPKKTNRRVWVGILAHEVTILHLLVSHPREERERFEPQATKVIASLKFLNQAESLTVNDVGVPLPPYYAPVDPASLVPDAQDTEIWQAFDGQSDLGALQAFYYRELPNFGWEISEFIPYPNQVEVNFGRIRIHKDNLSATLGILPFGKKNPQGKIMLKIEN